VTQASYQQPSCGCAANNNSQTVSPPPYNAQPPAEPTPARPLEPKPSVPNETPPATTTNKTPAEGVATPPAASSQDPATKNPEYHPKKEGNSADLESPKLFIPQDRTAKREIAPVHNALYTQPASYRQVSTARIVVTAEKSHKDAIGWTSASK
jgi:hypothetical protein